MQPTNLPTTARLMQLTYLPTTTSNTSLKATNRLMARNRPEQCLPIQLGPQELIQLGPLKYPRVLIRLLLSGIPRSTFFFVVTQPVALHPFDFLVKPH